PYQQYQGPYGPGPEPNANANASASAYETAGPHERELERMRQADQATLEEMRAAWARHPVLARLVGDNRRVYALGLLWDVFELRRARGPPPLPDHRSLTVRWFVHERHAQFRLEHAELARRQAHAHAQPPPLPPPLLFPRLVPLSLSLPAAGTRITATRSTVMAAATRVGSGDCRPFLPAKLESLPGEVA
ncbi:hypothetical protein VTH06DRAFT_4331, partial [Thermothelomyces fergusii]